MTTYIERHARIACLLCSRPAAVPAGISLLAMLRIPCWHCSGRVMLMGVDLVLRGTRQPLTPAEMRPKMGRPKKVKERWALDWTECRECGRTDREHRANGLCSICKSREDRQRAKSRWTIGPASPDYGQPTGQKSRALRVGGRR